MPDIHHWTVEETRALVDSFDALTGKDTPLTPAAVYTEFKNLMPQSLLTQTQISNKINTLARQEKVSAKELLRSGDQHRDQLQGDNDARKRKRDQSQDVNESNNVYSPSLKLRLGKKRSTVTQPESNCSEEQSESSLSSTVSVGTQNSPDDDTPDRNLDNMEEQSTASGRINMQVEPWEEKLLSYIRGYLHNNIHDHPPDHEHIRDTLEKAREETEQGIKCFLLARPPARLTPSSMTDSAKDLSCLLLRGGEGRSLESGLYTLYSGPGMTVEILLRVYAAAAIYRWVFLWSDERWDVPMPSEMCKLMGVCEQCMSRPEISVLRLSPNSNSKSRSCRKDQA